MHLGEVGRPLTDRESGTEHRRGSGERRHQGWHLGWDARQPVQGQPGNAEGGHGDRSGPCCGELVTGAEPTAP